MIRLTLAAGGATPDVIVVNGTTFLPTTRPDDRCTCGHPREVHRDGTRCYPDRADGHRGCPEGCRQFQFDEAATRVARQGEVHF